MKSLAVLLAVSGCGAITGIEPTAPPTTTERAVGFSLADQSGTQTTLDALLAKNDVALVFYRGHW